MTSPNTRIEPLTYTVDASGTARIGGLTATHLADTYGTPLYVLDGATVRAMAAAYRDTLAEAYPGESLVIYAGKANLNLGLCRVADQERLGLDVVSGGEVFTALQAGYPLERAFFNGNNKSVDELTLALSQGIGRITVDNLHELTLIDQAARRVGKTADVLLRVNPGIDCHTHDYIRTGHTDSKFGFDLSVLSGAVDQITGPFKDTIRLRGLHAHVGSQIFEPGAYEDLARVLLNIAYNIREHYQGLILDDLNLGGGLGIAYQPGDDPPDVPTTLRAMAAAVQNYAQALNYPLPRLLVEPGRSLVATAGVTLYTVGSRKDIPNVRSYVAIDGGMGDNIRPALYQAQYAAVVANKADAPASETVTIAGQYCESGDILLKDIALPPLVPGDRLLVFGTGAYNYSMASNYNRTPRPAMVWVEDGQAHLLVRRERYEDLLRQDLIPDAWLPPSAAETDDWVV